MGKRLVSDSSVYFGRLEQRDGSIWALQRQTATGTATWPLKGFLLQATEELKLDGSLGLLVSGGIFFPQRTDGAWVSRPGASFDFEIPSYDWWFVDGIIKAGVCSGFDLLAGLRWDHTSTRVNYSDNTRDDYVLNSYVPLIGAQVSHRSSDSALLIRCMGSPWVRGTMKYHFWDQLGYAEFGDFRISSSSSFFEILVDYRIKLAPDVLAGGFAQWNRLRVRTDTLNLSGSTAEPVDWAVDIQSFSFGGVVSVGFVSPI